MEPHRNVRPRRTTWGLFPENMEDTDQHPWLLVPAEVPPDRFQDDYVILSVLVNTLMNSTFPNVEIPYAYTAIGFAVKRSRLSAVTVLHIKKIICELIWVRTRQDVDLNAFSLVSNMTPVPQFAAPAVTWTLPNHLHLEDVRQGNPQPRRNLGMTWPVFILGREDQQYLDPYEKIESPAVYMAPSGTEIQFLTTGMNTILLPRGESRNVSRSSWQRN